MKIFQHIKSISRIVLVSGAFLLLQPEALLSGNDRHGTDSSSPTDILCPADTIVPNDPGQCSAVVTYAEPADATLVSGFHSGSEFPVGVTTNQWVLDDGTGECSFTVTVTDSEYPVFNCPGDINQSNSSGICQTVDFEIPEATDNCGVPTVVQTSELGPGDVFPAGTTIVSYQATDAAGNVSTCSFTVTIIGNNTTVLYHDGSTSQLMAPQGGLRYQRTFYLLTQQELAASDLTAGMPIHTIGFTVGVPQDEITNGSLKVYLQNTTDEVSRMDTNWIHTTSGTNTITLSGIAPGDYEWQVKSNCSGSYSTTSNGSNFSTADLNECNQPYNLETQNITATSATFRWEFPGSNTFNEFILEYSMLPFDTWTAVSTTETYYTVSGLTPETNYRWRIKTLCDSDVSPQSAISFITENEDLCNEPSGLTLGTVTNSSASVTWTSAGGADHYTLHLRKTGTTNWANSVAMTNSFTFTGLNQGTTYEWEVKAHCPAGAGIAVSGPGFTTTGETACNNPEELKAGAITESAATLSWLGTPGATGYEIRYRLKESISWEHVIAPMTLVSDGSIALPEIIGAYDIPFVSGQAFTYDGSGVYVALEYSNPTGSISSLNTSLCTRQNTLLTDANGLTTLVMMSFNGRTHAASQALPLTLRATEVRPETRLGSTAFIDMAEVASVYTMGYVALPYGSEVPVSAFVRNYTANDLTTPVVLTIYNTENDAIRHTETVNQLIPAYCGALVTFANWSPVETGIDSLVVSIQGQTGENVTDNNVKYILQHVNRIFQSYADDTPVLNGAGSGNEGGLILSRFSMNGCGKVNSADIFLHYSAAGHSLSAVLLDAAGQIIDTSPAFEPDRTLVNDYHSFYFPTAPLLSNEDYYIGLLQTASDEEYYPAGVQWEGGIIRDNAYYRADADGSNLTNQPYPGRLMIKAEILPSMPVPFISGSDILCAGSTNTLQAAGKTTRYANEVVALSSEYSNSGFSAMQALGSPDVFPEYVADSKTWISETTTAPREYLVLGFPNPAPVNFVEIYETFNPGAIDTVFVYGNAGQKVEVYSHTATIEPSESRANLIQFPLTDFDVSKIRIALNTSLYPGYHAIDAVGIGQINDPGVFETYSWSPGGETTSSIQVDNPGKYKLTVTNASNCQWSDSIVVTTPVITNPIITLSGPASFCIGGNVILASGETENNVWSTGETTQSITVTTSGTYSVTYNNGCESATSDGVTVTVNPLPVVSVSGGSICQGFSTLLNAGDGFASYLWSTGGTTSSISVSVPGEYSVTVTNENGCSASATGIAFSAPVPSPSITGDIRYCPGESTTLHAGSGYTSYLWSTQETTEGITISTPGEITVTVTNSYGCKGSDEVSTNEYPAPEPFISGARSLCSGSTTVLDAGAGYSSYLWSTHEITSSIVVHTVGDFSVTITDINGCVGTATATTDNLGTLPETPGAITGPIGGVCQTSGIVYSIEPVPNTNRYVWSVPEGVTITSGQGTPRITVDASSPVSGIITVSASNTCGQSPTWNGRVMILDGTPEIPAEITGQVNGVCGLTDITYTTDSVYGATSYNWTVPQGVTIISGNGTRFVTVQFTSSFTTGDICVDAENSCGTSGARCLTITGPPAQPAAISGPAEVCMKQKNVNYSVAPLPNVDTYQWTVPMQASIIAGQGTPSIVVNFGNKAGNIIVRAINSCGNSAAQQLPVNVVKCKGNDPLIYSFDQPNGGFNGDNPLWDYTWGNPIFVPEVIASAGDYSLSGATSVSWTIGEPVIQTIGEEAFILTQGFHQDYYKVVLDETTLETTFVVEVFPIPAKEYVNIRIISSGKNVDLLVELYDMMGNVVFRDNAEYLIYNHRVMLNHYATGMLLLKVTDVQSHQQKTFKIIKLK